MSKMKAVIERKTFNEMARDIDPGFVRFHARYLREQGMAFTSVAKRLRVPLKLVLKWTSFIKFRPLTKSYKRDFFNYYFTVLCRGTQHRHPSWDNAANRQNHNNYATLKDPDFRYREQEWRRRQQWARDSIKEGENYA